MISVVTVCLNSKLDIIKTIESVLTMKGNNFEYIIKDGGSTDGTIEIINSYKKLFETKGINYTVFVQSDKGIYDAMNQAISFAKGDWINFLNAGDVYYENLNFDEVNSISKKQNPEIIYGDTMWILKNGAKYVYINDHERLLMGRGLNQQAAFYNKQIFENRMFDASYKILGDFDFFLYLIQKKSRFIKMNSIVVEYNRYGISSTKTIVTMGELYEIMDKNGIEIKKHKIFILKIKEILNGKFPLLSDYLTCWHDLNNIIK